MPPETINLSPVTKRTSSDRKRNGIHGLLQLGHSAIKDIAILKLRLPPAAAIKQIVALEETGSPELIFLRMATTTIAAEHWASEIVLHADCTQYDTRDRRLLARRKNLGQGRYSGALRRKNTSL